MTVVQIQTTVLILRRAIPLQLTWSVQMTQKHTGKVVTVYVR